MDACAVTAKLSQHVLDAVLMRAECGRCGGTVCGTNGVLRVVCGCKVCGGVGVVARFVGCVGCVDSAARFVPNVGACETRVALRVGCVVVFVLVVLCLLWVGCVLCWLCVVGCV